MPIYIVRWDSPSPAACLVRAANKVDALILMDAIADPSHCEIKEYRGSLVIDIDLNVKTHPGKNTSRAYHTVVDDVTPCLDAPFFRVGLNVESETEIEILERCFPHYARYWGDHFEGKLDTEWCKKAIQQDFDDVEGRIAKRLGPPTVVEQAEEVARGSVPNG